jgi:hypothetical protein
VGDGIVISVRCHSGYTYAERPLQVLLEGKWHNIIKIVNEWRTPQGRAFHVICDNDQEFVLKFNEKTEEWIKE